MDTNFRKTDISGDASVASGPVCGAQLVSARVVVHVVGYPGYGVQGRAWYGCTLWYGSGPGYPTVLLYWPTVLLYWPHCTTDPVHWPHCTTILAPLYYCTGPNGVFLVPNGGFTVPNGGFTVPVVVYLSPVVVYLSQWRLPAGGYGGQWIQCRNVCPYVLENKRRIICHRPSGPK